MVAKEASEGKGGLAGSQRAKPVVGSQPKGQGKKGQAAVGTDVLSKITSGKSFNRSLDVLLTHLTQAPAKWELAKWIRAASAAGKLFKT